VIKVKYISVPKGLATAVSKKRTTLKAVCVFYQLKSIYVGGIIHDYTKRTTDIASTFGYSDRKLRTYIKILVDLGLADISKNKSLSLRSSKHIAKMFEVSEKSFHKIKADSLDDIEMVFRALSMQESITKQEHLLKKKIIDSAIKESVGINKPTSLSPTAYRRYKSIFSRKYDSLLAKERKRYTMALSIFANLNRDIFPYATLSRQGIAETFGFKSKATGQRYAKLLKGLKFINDSNNLVYLRDASYEEYTMIIQDEVSYDYSYKFIKGAIYKVLPNNISFNDSSFIY
jgi:hypothetical protein